MAESIEAASTEESPTHQQAKRPSDSNLRALLGPAWSRYQTALKGLADLGLDPEFYRYSPSGGWALRFQLNHVTGCALYLAQSLIGLVAVGARAESYLHGSPKYDDQIVQLVKATPRRGTVRWVKMPLRSQEDVRRFLTLVDAKIQARQAPKVAKESKSAAKDGKAAATAKKSAVSHKPRPRTSAASADRKKVDTGRHRSTARRNSRD